MSVIFLIGTLKAKAYAIPLPNESSYESARLLWQDSWSASSNNKMNQLCFYVGNESNTSGSVYCVFNGWPMQLSTNSNYISEENPNGYYYYRQYRFLNNQGYNPNYIMRYNGTSWSILCGTGITSWCVPNDYISYTNNNKVFITYYRQYNTDTDTDGIKSVSPVDTQQYNISEYMSIYYLQDMPSVESLPNIVYNISVAEDGKLQLNYTFNTPNTSGRDLILCIRYTTEGNEGFSCTRDFTENVWHRFWPIYAENTYTLSYEDFNTGQVLHTIELDITQYIESLPDIERQDLLAEYTYYNVDYINDNPRALTNLLEVLSIPIAVISEIIAYIWTSLNVYTSYFIYLINALIKIALNIPIKNSFIYTLRLVHI